MTKHALDVMVENVPDLASHLDKIKSGARRHGYFPDGSLLIEGEDVFDRLWDFIYRHALAVAGVWQPRGFGGLAEFGGKHCFVWYTNEYRDRLGEEDMHLRSPNEVVWPTRPSYQVSDLAISIVFQRKPSDEVRRRFTQCVVEWSEHVAQHGMFGEGPIRLVSSHVEFRGKLAQFRIDVSGSGQDTLNWLVLSVLNFGYAVSSVTDFVFDHEENLVLLLEGIHGRLEDVFGKATAVPFMPPNRRPARI